MSHFLHVVLIPKDTQAEAMEAYIERVLAPYNENIEVPEYDEKCGCIGSIAREAGWKAADAVEDIAALRKAHWAAYPEGNDEVWAEVIRPRELASAAAVFAHPMKDKHNPDCEGCNGSGTYRSTYNPQSKWDWWVIGGRWDGWVQKAPRDDGDGGFNFGDEHHQLANNSVQAETLKKWIHKNEQHTPHSLMTIDGMWHEQGEMGWFACVSNEKEEKNWTEIVVELLDNAGPCWAVGVDCHI